MLIHAFYQAYVGQIINACRQFQCGNQSGTQLTNYRDFFEILMQIQSTSSFQHKPGYLQVLLVGAYNVSI